MMAGAFELQLAEFARKAGARADDVVASVVVRIAAELDQRSPVGDAAYWKHKPPKGYIGGHFRANWQLGVNARPLSEIAGIDLTGERTQGRILAAIPNEAAGKTFWLANNAPYAQRLENGWSRQAPQGLVGLTVIKFETFVREATARMQ